MKGGGGVPGGPRFPLSFFKKCFSNPLYFQKRKSALVGFFLEKNPMTNKIEKFLYILEHLIPDGRDEIPTFALYHPLLLQGRNV